MAKYRPIFTRIWKDPDFEDLGPTEKLLFIYLFSNELTTDSGIYSISFKTISNETGIPLATVSELLANGKIKNIMYDEPLKLVFVVNFKKYNKGGKPALVEKGIVNDFKATKSSLLWDYFIKEYPIFKNALQTVDKRLDNGSGKNPTNPKSNLKSNPIKRALLSNDNKATPGRGHFSQRTGNHAEQIIACCKTIVTYPQRHNGQRFNPFQWVQFQANNNKHPAAILETVEALADKKTWDGIKMGPWNYATAIIKTKNGNWNERDHIAQAEKFKNLWISPEIQEIIKNIGY